MKMVDQLVRAVMDGESPKRFFHLQHLKKQRELEKAKPKPYVPPPTMPCHEWEEWENLESWQRIAARELQEEIGEMTYSDAGLGYLNVTQGHREYTVYADEEAAGAEARQHVQNDLNDEPGIFNTDFLIRFTNLDRLRDQLKSDEEESSRSHYDFQWNSYDKKRDELIENGYLEKDNFYDGDDNELEIDGGLERQIDSAYEEFIEKTVEQRLENPIEYLEEIYGHEDAIKQALEWGGIDTEAAAHAAVSEDGWQFYLARYGNSYDLPSGAVYVRMN